MAFRNKGIGMQGVKNAGFTATDITGAGGLLTDLKEGGFLPHEVVSTFYDLGPQNSVFSYDLYGAGYRASDFKASGYTLRDIFEGYQARNEGTFPLTHYEAIGYNINDFRETWQSLAEMKDCFGIIGLQRSFQLSMFTVEELKDAFTMEEIGGPEGLHMFPHAANVPYALRDRGFSNQDILAIDGLSLVEEAEHLIIHEIVIAMLAYHGAQKYKYHPRTEQNQILFCEIANQLPSQNPQLEIDATKLMLFLNSCEKKNDVVVPSADQVHALFSEDRFARFSNPAYTFYRPPQTGGITEQEFCDYIMGDERVFLLVQETTDLIDVNTGFNFGVVEPYFVAPRLLGPMVDDGPTRFKIGLSDNREAWIYPTVDVKTKAYSSVGALALGIPTPSIFLSGDVLTTSPASLPSLPLQPYNAPAGYAYTYDEAAYASPGPIEMNQLPKVNSRTLELP
jgi:hypothetical protein